MNFHQAKQIRLPLIPLGFVANAFTLLKNNSPNRFTAILAKGVAFTIPRLLTLLANQTWRRNSYGNLELSEKASSSQSSDRRNLRSRSEDKTMDKMLLFPEDVT